jgi:hypothetical protein
LVILLLAAGALIGAAAGGSLGYVAAGLTGAAIGVGAGAVAGFGIGAAAYALSRPVYLYPIPYPQYGYHYPPTFCARPRVYYTTAF